MSKFKVGDMVRYKIDGEVCPVVDINQHLTVVRTKSHGICEEDDYDLELVMFGDSWTHRMEKAYFITVIVAAAMFLSGYVCGYYNAQQDVSPNWDTTTYQWG